MANEAEFSKDWLGKSESYVRGLRFKGVDASTGSLAICASNLQHYGKQTRNTVRYRQLGKEFLELSRERHNTINEETEAVWLAA